MSSKRFKFRDVECLTGIIFGIIFTAIFGLWVTVGITIGVILLITSVDYFIRKKNRKNQVKPKRAFDRIFMELEDRNYLEKLWGTLKMMSFFLNCIVNGIIYKLPKNIAAKNDIADSIKDDIEFGYSREMIYGKIMCGNYGNENFPEKSDWFKKHNMDWKEIHDANYKPSEDDQNFFEKIIELLMDSFDDCKNDEERVEILYSVKKLCQMYTIKRPENWYNLRNSVTWMDAEGNLIYNKHLGGF